MSDKIFRPGKTAREHASGVHGNRYTNRKARESWQQDGRSTNANFPLDSCNGKKSQSLKSQTKRISNG